MRRFDKCPRCGAKMVKSIAINEKESEYWYQCTKCNTYVNSYIPQPHQMEFHKDPHKFKGNFGGYGSGKTTVDRQEIYKHIFLTPNANILIGANVSSQYEQTIKRDIEADFPKDLVAKYNVQKQYIDFFNGARLLYRPLDDVNKLRSYNLSMFLVIEGSEVDPEAFAQLKTRSRNMVAAKQMLNDKGEPMYQLGPSGEEVPIWEGDWIEGIIESNPDSGWIKSEVLETSSDIYRFGKVADDTKVLRNKKDPAISSHIVATECNAYLPADFIEVQSKNKPQWWINRYLKGSFSYSEGLVYPSAMKCLCDPFDIPKSWKRLVAADYGLSDDFVYLVVAIDEKNGIAYAYAEKILNDKNIEELSKAYFQLISDIPSGGMWCAPILDPKSGAKRDYEKKTLYDHFLDYGIAFQPGHVSVDARVYRLNTYFESGRLKIFNNLDYLIDELKEYKFPDKKLGGSVGKAQDKPVDKNNHAINPLEWITMALPKSPDMLMYGAYDRSGKDITKPLTEKDKQIAYSEFALSDNKNYDDEDYELGGYEL